MLLNISKLHINYKEVLAVVYAAKCWCTEWTNSEVTVLTDNVVAIINKGTL